MKVFGRTDESAVFRELNQELYASSSRLQFISGLIQPAVMFVSPASTTLPLL